MTFAVYLDTAAFMSAYESASARADDMLKVFDAIGDHEFGGVTSEVTLAELLRNPMALGQSDLGTFYIDILSGHGPIQVVPVARHILIETAVLRSRHPALRMLDAVHLATAIHRQCHAVLSNDEQLPLPMGMHAVRLTPHSLDDLRLLRA